MRYVILLGALFVTFSAYRAEPAVTLDVKSSMYEDVKVYAVRGGSRTRIGLAPGLGSERFTVRRGQLNDGLVLVLELDSFARGEVYRPEPLDVQGWRVVQLDIPGRLQLATVWPVSK